MKTYIYLLLLAIVLPSCTSDYYEEWTILKRQGKESYNTTDVGKPRFPLSGKLYAIGDYRQIDVYADNAFTMMGKSSVAMSLRGESQHIHDISLHFRTDSNLDIQKRSSRFDSQGDKGQRTTISISPEGTKIISSGEIITTNEDYRATKGTKIRARLIEDGKVSTVVFGCDTIATFSNYATATENTVFILNQPSDTVDVYGIEMLSLRDGKRPEFIHRPSKIRPF